MEATRLEPSSAADAQRLPTEATDHTRPDGCALCLYLYNAIAYDPAPADAAGKLVTHGNPPESSLALLPGFFSGAVRQSAPATAN